MGTSSRWPTRVTVIFLVVLTVAGGAVLIVDIVNGSSSMLLGLTPYVLLLPLVVAAMIAWRRKKRGWNALLITIIPIIYGVVMVLSNPERHWP